MHQSDCFSLVRHLGSKSGFHHVTDHLCRSLVVFGSVSITAVQTQISELMSFLKRSLSAALWTPSSWPGHPSAAHLLSTDGIKSFSVHDLHFPCRPVHHCYTGPEPKSSSSIILLTKHIHFWTTVLLSGLLDLVEYFLWVFQHAGGNIQ